MRHPPCQRAEPSEGTDPQPPPRRTRSISTRCSRAATEDGVAVEVNRLPDRLDLSAAHVQDALSRGRRASCSNCSDSHSERGLVNLDLAVATAAEGWCDGLVRSCQLRPLAADDLGRTEDAERSRGLVWRARGQGHRTAWHHDSQVPDRAGRRPPILRILSDSRVSPVHCFRDILQPDPSQAAPIEGRSSLLRLAELPAACSRLRSPEASCCAAPAVHRT